VDVSFSDPALRPGFRPFSSWVGLTQPSTPCRFNGECNMAAPTANTYPEGFFLAKNPFGRRSNALRTWIALWWAIVRMGTPAGSPIVDWSLGTVAISDPPASRSDTRTAVWALDARMQSGGRPRVSSQTARGARCKAMAAKFLSGWMFRKLGSTFAGAGRTGRQHPGGPGGLGRAGPAGARRHGADRGLRARAVFGAR